MYWLLEALLVIADMEGPPPIGGVCISGAVESRLCFGALRLGEVGLLLLSKGEAPYPASVRVEEWVDIRVIESRIAYNDKEGEKKTESKKKK